MTALFSALAAQTGDEARAQSLTPLTRPGSAFPSVTSTSAVQTSSSAAQSNQAAGWTSAVIEFHDPATIATVASTSGISGTSRPFAANPTYTQRIGRTVNPNPFLPSDSIADSPVIVLPSVRSRGAWDLSATASTAFNYDSNITRSPGQGRVLGDFYEHNSAAVDFRLGTASAPVALQLDYNYTADLFNRYTSFDTYTHNLNFQARIGRSNFILSPYFIGSFRSVDDPSARDSGRESYDYLQGGLRGEERITPDLIHTYDFSQTSVTYHQRTGDDFRIWRLYQELDLKPMGRQAPSLFPGLFDQASVFPWLDLKQTAPAQGFAVNEINGGIGGSVSLSRQVSAVARVGWGDVESNDPAVSHDVLSGWRYDASVEYTPLRELRMRLSYDRVLSFAPTTVGRSADVLDFVAESPLALDAHFTLIPAIEFYRSSSNDDQDPETSLFPQPSLQLTYEMNDHVAFFGKAQYRDTDDTQFGFQTNVRVLQTSVGVTATF